MAVINNNNNKLQTIIYLIIIIVILSVITVTKTINGATITSTIIDQLRHDYLKIEKTSWNIVENGVNEDHILTEIFEKHRTFTRDGLPSMDDDETATEFRMLKRIYEWNKLEAELFAVNNLFEAFRKFLYTNINNVNKLQSIDMAETVLFDKQYPINRTFDEIENIMVNQGLYYKAMLEANSGICDGKQSAQQVLYQLYTAISITELKAYSMMQFSYMILRTYGKGNYTGEARIMHDMFTKRTLKTQELLRKVMERATRYVWRCDPVHAVEGETYEQLTRLLQGYVENEVDMNNDGTCMENCAHYQYTDNFGCYKDMYCAKQPKCKGKLLYCQFIDSDMWICPSKYSETRRYQYIEYENGRVLGKNNQNCLSGTTKVDSWWRYLFWHCSYCLCMCDEQGPLSDRYFNLREATSNITENKVVTGLRFRKHKRIIHLQIQEGELLERGNINGSSLTWKPLSSYGLLDRGIKNGIDYFTMGWDKRAIDLDDVIAPTKHTVTGVRFRVIGTHLNLEIRVTEIDFLTGKLEPDEQKSYWIGNDNTDGSKMRRTMIELKNPDVPTLTIAKSIPDSTTNQFIEFTHSDIDADAAQTTVPFIDIQDVITIPPIPLSGAGIYHKGQPLYGGFVGPKLITYDLSSHIQTPEVEDTNDVELF